jgi:O-antigen ligase
MQAQALQLFSRLTKQHWFWLLSILFVGANTYALIHDLYWISSIPFVFGMAMLVFFNLEWALLSLSFIVPLSVNFEDVGFGLGISLPDEPVIILIMLLALFKIFIRSEYDAAVFRHPVTIALLLNFVWMLITSFTSELPLVSFKYMISRFWYIVVFYFMTIMLFKREQNVHWFMWLYVLALSIVIVYTLFNHSEKGFTRESSYLTMKPFYVAHGIYAAAIAFFIPFLATVVLFGHKMKINFSLRWLAAALLILFMYGLFYSYTRAAWLSVFALPALVVVLFFRIRLRSLLLVVATSVTLFLLFQNEVMYALSKNDNVSSTDVTTHLRSILNVTTDASNAERINRWMSAIEMTKERPWVGFGPGTYMFVYAPYQQSNYWTIISTNHGDVGNAHSEYFSALTESGYLGLITFLLMIYLFLQSCFTIIYSKSAAWVRFFTVSIMLGFVTYLIHALLNNYIESDKIAILWWGSMAMVVAFELYYTPKSKQE